MRRRDFIGLLSGAAGMWPLTVRAQQPDRMRRIGVVMGYAETDPAAQAQVAALRQELQKLGWEEGRNIRIDVRFSAADAGRVRAGLTELMSFTPDVLVANTNLVTAVVQAEVRTIPIVFIFVGDPIGSGFVSDDARPNGNLTGFANWDSPAMVGKWLELLKEVAPQVERVGFMMHPETPALIRYFKSAGPMASALNVKLVALGVHDAGEIERTLMAFAAEGNGGLIVGPHAVTLTNRDLILAVAARLRSSLTSPGEATNTRISRTVFCSTELSATPISLISLQMDSIHFRCRAKKSAVAPYALIHVLCIRNPWTSSGNTMISSGT